MNISSSALARTADKSALTLYSFSRDTETPTEPKIRDPVNTDVVLPARFTTFMNNHLESHAIRRVIVGTDRSETADQAVHWAAGFADRYDPELFVVQVEVPHNPATTGFGAAERTRAAAANNELAGFVRQVAGERLMPFYRFPQPHWQHLHTTNPVESPFAAARLRTDAAKRFKLVKNATAVIWKMLLVAE